MIESSKCPLCNQPVSKVLYEKITGIWQAKEKSLKQLREKEKQLKEKEKKIIEKFNKEKKEILNKTNAEFQSKLSKEKKIFEAMLSKEKLKIKKEKEAIEKNFQKKLSLETDRLLKIEKEKQQKTLILLKKNIELESNKKIQKEKLLLKKQQDELLKKEKIAKDKNQKLLDQYKSLQAKSESNLSKATQKIKSLEEQIKSNQTPQVLGLLEESIFLNKLKSVFIHDKFLHTGKGGDILHTIIHDDEEIGKIVYELKKVQAFSKSHIDQAYKAKQTREADYAVLITNAKRSKDDSGFSIVDEVIITHPAGAMVIISILRDHLIAVNDYKLGKEERDVAVKTAIEFIQSPAFVNSMDNIIKDTIDLYSNLKKEIKDHVKNWDFRFNKYKNINVKANLIDQKLSKVLTGNNKDNSMVIEKIEPIVISERIK